MNPLRLTALSGLFAISMMAQRPSPPDPATRVQNQVSRLTTLLNLTATQASQATTIFTNAATATSPLQAIQMTNRQSLQAAVKTNATSTIDQLASSLGTLNGQITSIQSKADAAFYAILTADQQAKLDQLGGFGGGFGGRGPGGPPPGRP